MPNKKEHKKLPNIPANLIADILTRTNCYTDSCKPLLGSVHYNRAVIQVDRKQSINDTYRCTLYRGYPVNLN